LTVSEFEAVLLSLEETEQVERYEAWQHTAQLSYVLAEINRDVSHNKKPYTPNDFMPVALLGEEKTPAKKPQTWEEMLQVIEDLNAGLKE
jgi:hypothetical protein